MKTVFKNLFTCLIALLCFSINAQELKKSDIVIKWGNSPHQGRIVVKYVENRSDYDVRIIFINEYEGGPVTRELKSGVGREFDYTCNIVRAKTENGTPIDLISKPKPRPEEKEVESVSEDTSKPSPSKPTVDKQKPNDVKPSSPKGKKVIGKEEIIPEFSIYLESIPFLSSTSIKEESNKIDEHINNLRNWKDKEAYISENHLNSYIKATYDSLTQYKNNSAPLIIDYLDKYSDKEIINRTDCIDEIQKIINNRLGLREANAKRLSNEIDNSKTKESFNWKDLDWKVIGLCSGLLLLVLLLLLWFRNANKKETTSLSNSDSIGSSDASSAIVVRRKTTSILKKQSLEDVIGNDAYLKIDCEEFCDDSAVRRMYIKNTCIKDIYNMYAEDLRDPSRPKEDGCMVLGRWVYDKDNNEYYISLEHIVLPGDDAIFAEYELNFGGKIKLKYKEKLRKLRRETNLQYDLTCWVHSHPGLTVFFSNSDLNVQMQLKDPIHPNFLTAIVIDILTPKQELGIFTFKRDSTVNSKKDLKKMYSLEEMYQWAVESERNSFKPEDHYNALSNSEYRSDQCYGIELSNGAIIDMGMLAAEQNTGLAGMAHGYCQQQGMRTEYVINTVSKNESVPDNDLIGCFIIASHCSIPSIRKAVASYMRVIKFVLVYTTSDGLLTSIPVVNNDICTDDKYYGEQKLEDLKIWTRRKR